ncbi:MAG: hypothetical protein HC897_17935 [Thermoanaerobaculia bacterium]|nr:hypothetical protein [Thermoanaerobaculia bacterium]
MNLLLRAIADAGSDDPEAVRQALGAITDFEGVTGKLGYAPGEQIPRKAVSLLEITEGQPRFVEQIVPAEIPAP